MKVTLKNRLFQLISVIMLLSLLLVGCGSDKGLILDTPDDDDAIPVWGKPIYNSTDSTTNNITNSSGNITNSSGKKRVAITFDDGPHNVYTKKIVDELAKYGAHATFFVVGNRIDGTSYNGKAGLSYAIDHGNEIGIHGYTHKKYYDRCSDGDFKDELSSTLSAIKAVSPSTNVRLMRPIGGAITDARVTTCPYGVIMWDVDSEDWKNKYLSSAPDEEKQAKAKLIADKIISGVKDNSIILMHDIYTSTYDALVIVLKYLYSEGYEVVTVSQLLGNKLYSGKKYYSGR